jgi:hypothetical protein
MNPPSTPDPTRYLLSLPTLVDLPDGRHTIGPYPLDAAAADWRGRVARHVDVEVNYGNRLHDSIVISADRGAVIANLLDELAERLRPGLAVGPIHSDGSISQLAQELAEDMFLRDE